MVTATQFGRALRSMRIETEESISQMAERLEYSTSFLSAVELGKKSVPPEMVNRLEKKYKLDAERVEELVEMASKTLNTVRINTDEHSDEGKQTLFALARALPELDDDSMRRLREQIDGIVIKHTKNIR